MNSSGDAMEFVRPRAARPGDGASWVRGWCWFYCGHTFTDVLWLGTITSVGASAPLYACGGCLRRLHDSAWDYDDALGDLPSDHWGRPVPLYAEHGSGVPVSFRRTTRRPRSPLGRLFHRFVSGRPVHWEEVVGRGEEPADR